MGVQWLAGVLMVIGVTEPSDAAPRRILVWPTVDGVDLPVARREKLEHAVTEGLGRAGASVRPEPKPTRVCDAGCRQSAAAAAGADLVVEAAVRVDEDDYRADFALYDGTTGELLARRPAECLTCGFGEAVQRIGDAAADVRRRAQAEADEPPRLHIDSRPSAARVTIDGTVVGTTPLTVELLPGRHQVALERAGYNRVQRTITAVAGVQEDVAFDLQPAPRTPRRRGVAFVGTGGAVMVAGAALLGTGIGFLVLDGRPFRPRCAGPDIDAQGNCRLLWQSRPEGIGLTVTGAVALSVATALLVHGILRMRERR